MFACFSLHFGVCFQVVRQQAVRLVVNIALVSPISGAISIDFLASLHRASRQVPTTSPARNYTSSNSDNAASNAGTLAQQPSLTIASENNNRRSQQHEPDMLILLAFALLKLRY